MSEATPQEVLDFWFSDRDDAGEVVFRRAWFDKNDDFAALLIHISTDKLAQS